jgi:hypothetical protein
MYSPYKAHAAMAREVLTIACDFGVLFSLIIDLMALW